MGKGSIFFHSISDNVQKSLLRRQAAYSAIDRGAQGGETPALTWGYAKTAFAELYWHCPKEPTKDKKICGSQWVAAKQKFAPDTPGSTATLYTPIADGDDRYFPPILLESVSITNEGRVGSLQKASVTIKCFNMGQLAKLEKHIMFPGADVRIDYGWTNGLGVKACDKDTFTGIISNFGWSMSSDLSISVNFDAVGKGFAVNAVPSTGINEESKESVTDENNNKIYKDAFLSRIKADLANLKDKVNTPGFYTAPDEKYPMVYGSQKFKYDASTEVVKKGESVTPPDEQTITYLKLSEILNYYNEVVLSAIPRIGKGNEKQVRFSANWGINKEAVGGDQEQVKNKEEVYLPVSISIYDPEVVSSDPGSVLFNDAACYMETISENGSPAQGFWQIPDGQGEREWCRFKRNDNLTAGGSCDNDGGVNLGEILIGTTYLCNVLENLSVNAQDPVSKSVQALGTELFKKINECSGGLYQLSWTEVEVKDGLKSTMWICVSDQNFTVCDPDVWLFHVDKPHKSLVRNASLSSKIPSGQQTALYVGGRSTGATDGNFTSAAKLTDSKALAIYCNMFEPGSTAGSNTQTPAAPTSNTPELPSIAEARKTMGTTGCTATSRANLVSAIKKYIADQKKASQEGKGGANNDRYTFMRRDLYPLECSITLDGIAGFRFGDAVMIDYVPQRYRYNLCFIVTKTEHRISNNKWETVLKLQARTHATKPKYLNPDGKYGGGAFGVVY